MKVTKAVGNYQVNNIGSPVRVLENDLPHLEGETGLVVDREVMDDDVLYLVSVKGEDEWLMETEVSFI